MSGWQKFFVSACKCSMRAPLVGIMVLLAMFLILSFAAFPRLYLTGFLLVCGGLLIRELARAVKRGEIPLRKAASVSLAVSAGVYAVICLIILAARPVLIPPFEALTVREVKLSDVVWAGTDPNTSVRLRIADDPQEFVLKYYVGPEFQGKLKGTLVPNAPLRIWISRPEYRRWNESEHLIWQLEVNGALVHSYDEAVARLSGNSEGERYTRLELSFIDIVDRYLLAPVEWLFGVRRG